MPLCALLVQQTENAVLVPRLMDDALRLRPAVIMVALAVGGAMAGPRWPTSTQRTATTRRGAP